MKSMNPFWILRKGLTLFVTGAMLAVSVAGYAAPSGGVVTAGNAEITQAGSTTNINQSSQNAAINWQSFSIKPTEAVNFYQPNKNAVMLNRVVGNESSVINGALNANGQIFILNSNGILFGKNSSVNTAGLAATTMQMSNKNFMAGSYKFTNASDASIINKGTINISSEGYAALFGKTVENSGTINVVKGTVHMAGADAVTLDIDGNSLIELTVEKSLLDAMVANSGAVKADGGDIYLTTSSADDLMAGVVNNTGVIKAESIEDLTGEVVIFAHGGTANVGGEISTGKGEGFIETSGDTVNFAKGVKISSGNWLIDPTDITVDATLASTLESQLSSGDAEIETTDGSITFTADLNVSGGNDLTVNAAEDINVNSTINVNDTSGLYLNYGGDLTVALGSGVINMGSGTNLHINSSLYNIISNYAQWSSMSSGNYALGADIDLNGINYSTIATLSGSLEGLGHTVDNLTLSNTNSNIGLFGELDTVSVSNLKVTNASVTTTGFNAGILASYAETSEIHNVGVSGDVTAFAWAGGLIGEVGDNVVIKNSYSEGSVEGTTSMGGPLAVGGLIGFAAGNSLQVSDSYSTADVTGHTDQTGGLIGYAQNVTIENSYATGDVSGYRYTGGLVGGMANGTIENSYATGNVSSTAHNTGGLVGAAQGSTVTDSYATGNVSSSGNNAGGLIGLANSSTNNISGSYATGSVSGAEDVGGLIGELNSTSTVEESYATGDVTATGDHSGGLIGKLHQTSTVTDSYATGNVSGVNYVGAIAGYIENVTITDSFGLGAVSGSTEVFGIGYQTGTNNITGTYYNSGSNPNLTEDANNTSATYNEIVEMMQTEWDPAVWTGETVNMGFPLLQWQELTNLSLNIPSGLQYGATSLTQETFLSNYASYDGYSYVILDANGNDVTAQAEAGYLAPGTYTIKLVVAGEYDVTNSGSTMTIGQKELNFSIDTDTFTEGEIISGINVTYEGLVTGGQGITGSAEYHILDANSNDVTAQAEAGTLEPGEYTFVITMTDDNYTVSNSTTITVNAAVVDTPEVPEAPNFIPAIINNIATQPVIQFEDYGSGNEGQFTQKEDAEAPAEEPEGDDQTGDLFASAYFDGKSGFSNSYEGLVEIINGGIKLPDSE